MAAQVPASAPRRGIGTGAHAGEDKTHHHHREAGQADGERQTRPDVELIFASDVAALYDACDQSEPCCPPQRTCARGIGLACDSDGDCSVHERDDDIQNDPEPALGAENDWKLNEHGGDRDRVRRRCRQQDGEGQPIG